MQLFNMFQNALYEVLKAFQSFTEPVLGGQSYWFAIVLLTLSVRTLLVPLTVKQFRSAKAMRKLAPELKALKDKHKGDTTKQAEAATALYREHGVSPLSGCLPLIAQAPFLFALFHVIRNPSFGGEPNILLGHTVFGIALDTRWMELGGWGARLGSVAGLTVLALIALMTCTTYFTQRRMMAQAAAPMTGQQAAMMKVLPLTFPIMAVNFPLAVIIYWVTTNLWTMGQQFLLTRASGLPADEVAAVPAPVAVGAVTEPDDLTKIAGIGPKMAMALAAGGITTFRQLAETDVPTLRNAVTSAGLRSAPSLPTWPERAKQLVDTSN